MVRRRCRDADGIDPAEEGIMGPVADGIVFRGDLPGPIHVAVDHTDQIDIGHVVVFLGVKFPQVADADDPYAQFCHGWFHPFLNALRAAPGRQGRQEKIGSYRQTMAMPCSSARRTIASRSKTTVRSASTASARTS